MEWNLSRDFLIQVAMVHEVAGHGMSNSHSTPELCGVPCLSEVQMQPQTLNRPRKICCPRTDKPP